MRLIFVFNASSQIHHKAIDFIHKIAQPSTYNCHLCQLTYGNVGKRKSWKEFEEQLPLSISYYHKDEFVTSFPNFSNEDFPIILLDDELLFSGSDMKNWNLDDLKQEISKVIKSP